MHNFILQTGNNDCGSTSLKILLSYCHKDQKYLYLKFDDKALSFYDLIQTGEEYGVSLKGYRIKDLSYLKKKKYVIAQTIKDDISHIVVIKNMTKRKVIVLDPSRGKIIYKHKDFLDIFTGLVLINEKTNKNKLTKKNKINSAIYNISYSLSLFFDIVMVYFLTDFIKNNSESQIAIYILLGAILNFILKIIILHLSQNEFDKRFIFKEIDANRVKALLIFKKDYLRNNYLIIDLLALVIVYFIIFISNGDYHFFIILFSLIYFKFMKMIINPILNRKLTKINDLENKTFNESFKEEEYIKCNKIATKYAYLSYLPDALYMVLIFIILLIINKDLNYNSLSFIVINLMLYSSFYVLMKKLMNLLKEREYKIKKDKAKLDIYRIKKI